MWCTSRRGAAGRSPARDGGHRSRIIGANTVTVPTKGDPIAAKDNALLSSDPVFKDVLLEMLEGCRDLGEATAGMSEAVLDALMSMQADEACGATRGGALRGARELEERLPRARAVRHRRGACARGPQAQEGHLLPRRHPGAPGPRRRRPGRRDHRDVRAGRVDQEGRGRGARAGARLDARLARVVHVAPRSTPGPTSSGPGRSAGGAGATCGSTPHGPGAAWRAGASRRRPSPPSRWARTAASASAARTSAFSQVRIDRMICRKSTLRSRG